MGEVRFQNEALTSDMVVGLSNMLNSAWKASEDELNKESLEELMAYILIGFGAGLRREGVPLVAMTELCHSGRITRGTRTRTL